MGTVGWLVFMCVVNMFVLTQKERTEHSREQICLHVNKCKCTKLHYGKLIKNYFLF